jgi:isoamylase
LRDLVSYNKKHNEANGEENRDGTDNNRSWNCGVEGESDDPEIGKLRARQKRNLLATLLLSQGVPMVLAGDAIGHTQLGNNNAYCQDNEISWINWDLRQEDKELLEFTRLLISLRKSHPAFHRRNFFQGRAIKGAGVDDILWLRPDGKEMTDEEWGEESPRCLGLFLDGQGLGEVDDRGQMVTDQDFLVLTNAHFDDVPFQLPVLNAGAVWATLVDTSCESSSEPNCRHEGSATYQLKARSLAVLVAEKQEAVDPAAGRA